MPLKPYKPNRSAIIFIAIVLGLGAGIGTVGLEEALDDRVFDTPMVQRATGFPVLGAIPVIVTTKDRAVKWRNRAMLLFGLASVGILLLAVVWQKGWAPDLLSYFPLR